MSTTMLPPMPVGLGGSQSPTIGQQGQPTNPPTMPSGIQGAMTSAVVRQPQQIVENFMMTLKGILDEIQALAGDQPAFAPTARMAQEILENGIQPVVASIQGAEQPSGPSVTR